MARLEAKAKMLYYPTPDSIVAACARALSVKNYALVRLLDPCAGKGKALAQLARLVAEQHDALQPSFRKNTLTIETYGIEPELLRAKEAYGCLTQVLQASFFSTTLSNGEAPDGGWQGVFLNPPYDTDSENIVNGRKTRLEVNFLHRATLKLCAAGILIWIVPQYSLSYAASFLASHYQDIQCFRFPDEMWTPEVGGDPVSMYEQFKQVVLFARKRRVPLPTLLAQTDEIETWARAGTHLQALPLSGPPFRDGETYELPPAAHGTLRNFMAGSYNPDHTAQLLQVSEKTKRPMTGVWASADYLAARFPDPKSIGLGIGTPLAPLKNAHLAVLSVAGIANRAVLQGKDGRRVIVKGYSRKNSFYSKFEDDEQVIEKTTDAFETALWCTDLATGGLIRVETGKASAPLFNVPFESMSLIEFLDIFGTSLTQQVAASNPPRYTQPQDVPWHPTGFAAIKRKPLGKQRDTILSIVHSLVNREQTDQTHDELVQRIGVVAEMATGKTYLALCSAFLGDLYACGGVAQAAANTQPQHLFPLIVLCPPIIARKWKREAEQTLPNVRAVIVKRMGSATAKDGKDKEPDEEETHLPDGIAEFRQFDPSFKGTALSAVGCMDRVVARIGVELATWQHAYTEAQRAGTPLPLKPCHIVILTTSTAKLGMEWMPVYRLKVARFLDPATKKVVAYRNDAGQHYSVPCCPTCFQVILDERKLKAAANVDEDLRVLLAARKQKRTQGSEGPIALPRFALTEQDLLGTKDKRVKRFCQACGEALWQYVPVKNEQWRPYSVLQTRKSPPLPLPTMNQRSTCITSTARRRYPMGDYVLNRYKGFFKLLIADEVHEGADGTALDFARQSLAQACGRKLGLTGTLSNGYSRSLFRLYYVLNPSVRRDFQYDEAERWVDLYGKRQTTQKTYKEQEAGDGASSKRRVGTPVTREVAGFAPQGLARVLPCSTFLELVDVAPSLPSYREEVRVVPLGEVLGPVYWAFEQETTRAIGRMLARGDKSGLSTWWNGLLTYPNLPYGGWVCRIKKTGEVFGEAPALPEETVYPKERAILDLVQAEVKEGRRVLLYTENTGYYDIQPRLKLLLERKVQGRFGAPLRVAILRSTTVSTIDREAWLDKQVTAGCDVLICNPKLVKVGLDLIPFPTIIYASIPKSTSDLRQSSRRSLRPGQTKPVRVIFFVYPTMESRLLRLMAKKTKASLMVEGKLPGEGLVSFGEDEGDDEGDMMLSLAREVLAALEQGTRTANEEAEALQDLFREAAQIEREKNQVIGTIEEGQQEEVVFGTIEEVPLVASDLFEQEQPPVISAPRNENASEPPPVEPLRVTVIPLSVTSSDPWAELRRKHGVQVRVRRKKGVVSSEAPSLWSSEETQGSVQPEVSAAPSPGQPSLW